MKFIICLLFCLVGYAQIPNNIIIGDSQTPYVDRNSKKVERVVGLWKGGIDVPILTKMVQGYKVSPNVQNVFYVLEPTTYMLTKELKNYLSRYGLHFQMPRCM